MIWFDEDLVGERAGPVPVRGSGVLIKSGARYFIAQYNLAFTIPNERFEALRALLNKP
jgi:hypothetical protein